jgi:hypothetical protein
MKAAIGWPMIPIMVRRFCIYPRYRTGKKIADQIDSGMVFINHPTWTQADLPFGTKGSVMVENLKWNS